MRVYIIKGKLYFTLLNYTIFYIYLINYENVYFSKLNIILHLPPNLKEYTLYTLKKKVSSVGGTYIVPKNFKNSYVYKIFF